MLLLCFLFLISMWLLFLLVSKHFMRNTLKISAKISTAVFLMEAISLWILIYWHCIDEHERLSVYVCIWVHTLRQGLNGLCVRLCVFSHSSKCTAGIPGHLREQRKADCWAEEVVGSEHRLPEKRVGEEGMRKSWRAWIFCSPTPLAALSQKKSVWWCETSRLHCKWALLYCKKKNLYSLLLCLNECFGFFFLKKILSALDKLCF